MKITKLFILILLMLFIYSVSPVTVHADEIANSGLFEEQLRETGADELEYALPDGTREILSDLGIDGVDTDKLSSLSFNDIISKLTELSHENSKNPLRASAAVAAILIITAVISGFKTAALNSLSQVVGIVSTLCICTVLVYPIVDVITQCGLIIESSAKFMLAYVPVMVAVMISSGQAMAAASYKVLMMSAGEAVYQISSNVLVPFMNIFMGLSIASAVSPRLKLSSVNDLIYRGTKWVLGFIMSIFAALLTLREIIAAAGDTAGVRAVKLAINSFVPLVGGAISDAYQTVHSCIKLLKSGVGVFAILGVAFIFIPVVIKCVLWLLAVNVCAGIGDILDLNPQSELLRSCGKVLGTLLAILFSCIVVFIISTAIILILGGG